MKLSVTLFFMAYVVCSCQVSGNIIQNPGFEDSIPFNHWLIFDPNQLPGSLAPDIVIDPFNVHTGTQDALLGPVGAVGYISQDLATIPGQSYTLSFWLANDGNFAGTLNDVEYFAVSWNDTTAWVLPSDQAYNGFQYTQIVLDNMIATSSVTTLKFLARQDPGEFWLDDVSVTPMVVVAPEPGSATLFLSIGGVCAVCMGITSLRSREKK